MRPSWHGTPTVPRTTSGARWRGTGDRGIEWPGSAAWWLCCTPTAVKPPCCTPAHPLRRAPTRPAAGLHPSRSTWDDERVSTPWPAPVAAGPVRGGAADCGLAGTVMRFVPPAAALADGPVRFDGDPRARERPMGTVLDALRALGARV